MARKATANSSDPPEGAVRAARDGSGHRPVAGFPRAARAGALLEFEQVEVEVVRRRSVPRRPVTSFERSQGSRDDDDGVGIRTVGVRRQSDMRRAATNRRRTLYWHWQKVRRRRRRTPAAQTPFGLDAERAEAHPLRTHRRHSDEAQAPAKAPGCCESLRSCRRTRVVLGGVDREPASPSADRRGLLTGCARALYETQGGRALRGVAGWRMGGGQRVGETGGSGGTHGIGVWGSETRRCLW